MRFTTRVLSLLVALALIFTVSSAFSSTPWPRTINADGQSLTLYQPQVTSWSGNTLSARCAVSVLPQGAAQPIFGTVTLTANTSVDKVAQTVALANISVSQANFPSAPDQASVYASQVANAASQWAQNIPLDAVNANLAVTQAESAGSKGVAVQNTPPTIIFSESPAILVLVDGQPALRSVANSSLLRVINTQALILMDETSGLYYLRANNDWLSSRGLTGPWVVVDTPVTGLDAVLQQAQSSGNVQLFTPPADSVGTPVPTVFVSTTPAELVITQGAPQFEPVAGTQLLHITNSGSSIFMNVANQSYYVVISGRWFMASSLQGPWQFVPANQLPPDFANIPETAPSGVVLASVAGTPQAQEAVISSTIPQTATIARTTTTQVPFDGDPQFLPIQGTGLSYAKNSTVPVIKVASDEYYAVVNGVWFRAKVPAGPWVVADRVPDVIYSIPPSSPVYYATNVYVYGSTSDLVYVGYTPGYYGVCLAPEGVLVYGTGYIYPPYVAGDVWIGPPMTYGFGAGFACGLATGFAFGLAVDHGWGCTPWWGPWRGGWGDYNVNINREVTNNWNNVNVNRQNVYNRWGDNVVNNGDISKTVNSTTVSQAQSDLSNWKQSHPNANVPTRAKLQQDSSHLGDNTVFAGDDGKVYRSDKSGKWQQYDADRWSDANDLNTAQRSNLDSQRYSRSIGGFRGGGGRR